MHGKGCVITTAGTVDVYAAASIQGTKGQQQWTTEIVQDFGGFDAAWLARNEFIELSLTLKLTAVSRAAANLSAVFMLPFATITLSGFDLDWINVAGVSGRYTGAWGYIEGGSIDLNNGAVGGVEIKVRKYANAAQNTAFLTTVAA